MIVDGIWIKDESAYDDGGWGGDDVLATTDALGAGDRPVVFLQADGPRP